MPFEPIAQAPSCRSKSRNFRTVTSPENVLNISPRTAASHKYEMMNVLGYKTAAELIQHARSCGWFLVHSKIR
jgi:hypothetical protein